VASGTQRFDARCPDATPLFPRLPSVTVMIAAMQGLRQSSDSEIAIMT